MATVKQLQLAVAINMADNFLSLSFNCGFNLCILFFFAMRETMQNICFQDFEECYYSFILKKGVSTLHSEDLLTCRKILVLLNFENYHCFIQKKKESLFSPQTPVPKHK